MCESFPANLELLVLLFGRLLVQLVRLVSTELDVDEAVTVRTAPSVIQTLENVAVLLDGLELPAPTVSLHVASL